MCQYLGSDKGTRKPFWEGLAIDRLLRLFGKLRLHYSTIRGSNEVFISISLTEFFRSAPIAQMDRAAVS